MPTVIALLDGTKFKVDGSAREVLDLIGDPVPGWVSINEGDDIPERHFNPANVAYVIEAQDKSGAAFL